MGQLSGRSDPATDAHWNEPPARKGFFTDTSICIGCKACEVACKEWNHNPVESDQHGGLRILGSSYDNTGALGASSWRHVAFIEQDRDRIEQARETGRRLVGLGMPGFGAPAATGPGAGLQDMPGPVAPLDITPPDTPEFRWLMASDVCKHCTHAGCLDVCPTGALFRTEFGTVVVQDDVCNGCGTCVAGCPFGVIERRADGTVQTPAERDGTPAAGTRAERNGRKSKRSNVPKVGIAQKCTLCYDRLLDGQAPACAKTCPTTSIRFGDRDEMVSAARQRVAELHKAGMTEARLYGANDNDGVGGIGSVFLL
ncbi:MAG: 4Fe-4S dicluster domain-containing protein, partial [Microlunatus sp.]|nr:4Fe-4S dicluster domain-containing protein [Microlunatus sp.]